MSEIATSLEIIAANAAMEVGEYLRKVFRRPLTVFNKSNAHDPVTVHDRFVENRLYYLLGTAIPNSLVWGEENGEYLLDDVAVKQAKAAKVVDFLPADCPIGRQDEAADSILSSLETFDFSPTVPRPYSSAEVEAAQNIVAALGKRVRWIVDPIDGTANFASGSEYFNTSIGVEVDGKMQAGVVYQPFTNELYAADDTHAHYCRDGVWEEIRAEGAKTESGAVLTGYLPLRGNKEKTQRAFERACKLASVYATLRSPGAAALDLAHVAAGHTGVAIGTSMRPWDVAAGFHLVKMAGGHITAYPVPKYAQVPQHLQGRFVAAVGSLEPLTALEIIREINADN